MWTIAYYYFSTWDSNTASLARARPWHSPRSRSTHPHAPAPRPLAPLWFAHTRPGRLAQFGQHSTRICSPAPQHRFSLSRARLWPSPRSRSAHYPYPPEPRLRTPRPLPLTPPWFAHTCPARPLDARTHPPLPLLARAPLSRSPRASLASLSSLLTRFLPPYVHVASDVLRRRAITARACGCTPRRHVPAMGGRGRREDGEGREGREGGGKGRRGG